MRRVLIALLLWQTLTGHAFARKCCVSCEENCGVPPVATPPLTEYTFGCDDIRQSPTCRRIKPVLCQPRVANAVEPRAPLQTFLKRWTESAQGIREVRATLHTIEYNTTFDYKKRGIGEIGVRRHHRGWIRINGIKPQAGETYLLGGHRLAVRPEISEEWYYTDRLIYKINRDDKSYQAIETSWNEVEAQIQSGENIRGVGKAIIFWAHGGLHWNFLIPPSLTDLQKQFDVSLVKDDASTVRLKLTPLRPLELSSFKEIELIIDAKTLQTQAVKYVSQASTGWSVRIFNNQQVVRAPGIPKQIPMPALSNLRDLKASPQINNEAPMSFIEHVTAAIVGFIVTQLIEL